MRAAKRQPAASSSTSVERFFEKADPKQRDELKAIDALVRKAAPKLTRKLWLKDTLLGYGEFHYKYASGREGDSPLIALSARKQYISLYVCAVHEGRYLAEAHAKALAPASVGKSCIRFKRLEQLDAAALTKLLKLAVKVGGAFAEP